jgi:hypothetical protein
VTPDIEPQDDEECRLMIAFSDAADRYLSAFSRLELYRGSALDPEREALRLEVQTAREQYLAARDAVDYIAD